MLGETPPASLPCGWDFGQSPQWEMEQTPEPELMETGENNDIVSCGLLSMLRPRAFSSRAGAVFCHSLAREFATDSTSCNESWFKMYTSIKKKKGGGTLSHEGYEEIFNSVRQ